MSEEAKFLAHFKRKQAKGLQDTKFCVENGSSLQREDFQAASNRLDDAIVLGNFKRLTSWDRDPEQVSAPELA